ncbi:acyl-CoA dehydrogenase family protein [Nocardia sp. NBC_00508]|uniref:acyl-CoA dehydrogenase family protein n=1 Tax=Nocardia sp. NBC_00508 TaxID=2975992 RepID=UPI002E803530|nr:acyl-CoA dehydrogenase family protein [Nocardia sp. NBC_00508]WUD67108.1 acyl-CoA dehydrogenase family protein [Nocardia sp. NBC_00508]
MRFRDTPAEAAFRSELRTWLARNAPAEKDCVTFEQQHEWQRVLAAAGWVGVAWPVEHGGRGASLIEQAIFNEEITRARAPQPINAIGLGMVGPTIMAVGTREQKDRYLQKILAADEIWCQGFSEPGSGSDLGSLRTRAAADGDDFVVNGQKVWTSFGNVADRCALLARTDPEAGKYQGITYFLLDMHTPGVEVRPLRQLNGDAEFCEIFLTDVRIPRENILGEINGGWKVAMTTLMHERGTFGFTLVTDARIKLQELVALATAEGRDGSRPVDDPVVRQRLAQLYVDVETMWLNAVRGLSATMKTGIPSPEASLSKLGWSETTQRIAALAVEILGPAALVTSGLSPWPQVQLRSLAHTIEAGTSEVLRNSIAERVLGLPRYK